MCLKTHINKVPKMHCCCEPSVGPRGFPGLRGSQGIQGWTGPQGDQGWTGPNEILGFGFSGTPTINSILQFNITGTSWEATDGEIVKLGLGAGFLNQGTETVAIGVAAGANNQSFRAIAIGSGAGLGGGSGQSDNAIAIGLGAGSATQGESGIAIGTTAGEYQGDFSIAMGYKAGKDPNPISGFPSLYSISIGYEAGMTPSNANISIGYRAGYNWGTGIAGAVGSVFIGYEADGAPASFDKVIFINGTGGPPSSTPTTGGFFVEPMNLNTDTGGSVLTNLPTGFGNVVYNPTTLEIAYQTL
jgi:hypothetical protein